MRMIDMIDMIGPSPCLLEPSLKVRATDGRGSSNVRWLARVRTEIEPSCFAVAVKAARLPAGGEQGVEIGPAGAAAGARPGMRTDVLDAVQAEPIDRRGDLPVGYGHAGADGRGGIRVVARGRLGAPTPGERSGWVDELGRLLAHPGGDRGELIG